jgi:hypothetical protein
MTQSNPRTLTTTSSVHINTINNVDIDLLPEFIQDVILREFSKLPIKHKLIIYAKLVHGHLFKVTSNDLFNINKQTPGVVYRKFIKDISVELRSISNESSQREKSTKRKKSTRPSKRSTRKK